MTEYFSHYIIPMLSFAGLTFTSFFPMVDPLGNIPIFTNLTEDIPEKTVRRLAKRSCLFALAMSLFFGFLGEHIFEMFGLTLDGLKVVGGVIFFIMGYEMLSANFPRSTVSDHPDRKLNADEIAITPLAMPLLCGPGVITNSIIFMSRTGDSIQLKFGYLLGMSALFFFTTACFLSAKRLMSFMGPSGSRLILRLMGLFLMIIAVDSFFNGLTPIIRNILKIS